MPSIPPQSVANILNESELAAALSAAQVGTFRLDWDTFGLWLSSHAQSLLGVGETSYPAQIEHYKTLLARVVPEDRKQLSHTLRQALRGQTPWSAEFRVQHPARPARWLEGKGQFRKNPSGNGTHMIGIITDISKRKYAEQERLALLHQSEQALRSADEASRTKDEFLMTISHELRTPLTVILGWSRILKSRPSDPLHIERAAHAIESSAKGLAQIVEDMIDVSRLVSGRVKLNPALVDLRTVAKAAHTAVIAAAEAKGVRLEAPPADPYCPVWGDADRLQQIVWNILSNAIKFTPAQGRVSMRLLRSEHEAELSISDTGKGISSEFLPYLFERFRQADATTTRKFGGVGLGLALVRHLIEMHGGTVRAESEGEGRGSTFTISLPIRSDFLYVI